MEERRKAQRHKTLKGGTLFCEGVGSIECVIRNLSDIGANIEVSGATMPRDTFSLIIRPETIKRTCQVVWREGRRLGVKFV
jgi:PilZ domain